ncbi:GNAT family N-acetyltransferase [Kribbella sp. NPDC050124]|uniref:GNAT family N-acetyltransferase n=1 Tax=Kribbella sp. NPDC050124 TaxID=3364114 RepID=UPI00379F4658
MTDFLYKPTLAGELVILRPVDEGDYEVLAAAIADPEVTRLMGSRGELGRKTREWYRTRKDQTDRIDLAIVDKATGETVGETALYQWDPDNHSCTFRILIGPAGQGRGLGTEATRLIVGYGIEEVGLHRIGLGVFAFNPRAQRTYEKAGFVVEGRLREALYWDGEWVDSIVMSVLAPEWKANL